MVTKEWNTKKKCCLYTSDFHLEMILLPYIKENIDKSEFIIMTQNDLSETIKILLSRININESYKQKILNLNWKSDDEEKITNLVAKEKDINIIVKGNYDYIQKINQKLKSVKTNKINVIDCYCLEDRNLNVHNLKNQYDMFLNTEKI